ncbi:Lethal(2)neighbour of Tid protein [Pseudolycoriella hygida]|uniref:dolichyl-P-Man:Man5GlcNAc2-PP-dolichol alpha-1,3-mannosyltransferase n=1 Tax=Pseudolycoriella hygida TaxID=35572 RepID=A0A9Q0N1C9_9DIPT|nr:Lethal(2)neighbour of Tid protein [Pseudolycoriella hygida]
MGNNGPIKRNANKTRVSNSRLKEQSNKLLQLYNKYVNFDYGKSLLFDASQLQVVSIGILIVELILNVLVVQNTRYTEIDWRAYMQECEGFLNGTTDYALLKGDTGPLVYPAGFVYIYSILYFITSKGQNIRLAQYIFVGIYLLQMFLVLRIYTKARKVPPYVLIFSAFTSYRIHSIYVLRLFNDPIAILLFYIAFNLFIDNRWTLGSVFFSLGVTVKMNILLFAPAILLMYITNLGYAKTLLQLIICGFVQLVLGAPFLASHPVNYIKGSFDIGRIFEHKWTVNYRFLSRYFFEHRYFHLGLLTVHLLLLIAFFRPCYHFMRSYARLRLVQKQLQPRIDKFNAELKQSKAKKEDEETDLTVEQQKFLDSFEKSIQHASGKQPVPKEKVEVQDRHEVYFDKAVQLAVVPVFLANFIGVICARSLHYQFYVWYFHTLPYLAWFTEFDVKVKFLLLGFIEFAWNTYPSTDFSSGILHVCHIVLLFGIVKHFFNMRLFKKIKND